jgi:peptidoglycan/LPS O-acetylase OafA/YrhL
MNASLKTGIRPDIEGLRALAVVAVIINHFNKDLLPSGYLGVDIFFVISGFVITGSLVKRSSPNFRDFLLQFYTRRIKRLVPALILCVVTTSAIIVLLDPDPARSLRTGLASLFGLSNMYLLHLDTDYYAPSTELNTFTQTWSLGVEEQFYFLFPFLIWFLYLTHGIVRSRTLIVVLVALSLSSVVAFAYLSNVNQPAAYFLMPTRFWQLGIGCILSLIGTRGWWRPVGMLANALTLSLFVGVIAVLFSPIRQAVPATIAVVLLTALLIATLRPQTAVYRILSSRPSVYIGLISYSLYLWHWTVLSISRWTIGIHWWSAPFQAGLIALVAIASYHFVETPLRRAKWSSVSALSIIYGLSASSVSALFLLYLASSPQQFYLASIKDIQAHPAFLPLLESGLPYDPTCVVDGKTRLLMEDTFDKCTILPKHKGAQMIWALGDSHAGHLQGLLYAVHEQTGIGVHLIETPGTPFPLTGGRKFESRDKIVTEISERWHEGDIVLISRLFVDRASGNQPIGDLLDWNKEVAALAKNLSESGISVVVAGPPPIFAFAELAACLSSLWSDISCDVDRASIATGIEAVYRSLGQLADQNSNVHIFDQFDLLCPKSTQRCSPIKDGESLFRDKDHLNSYGSASIADSFIDFLRSNKLLKSE